MRARKTLVDLESREALKLRSTCWALTLFVPGAGLPSLGLGEGDKSIRVGVWWMRMQRGQFDEMSFGGSPKYPSAPRVL